jgi:hypothetical protein
MEYDRSSGNYELTDEEAVLFGLPEDTYEWPNADAGELLERVQRFEQSVADMDVTAVHRQSVLV